MTFPKRILPLLLALISPFSHAADYTLGQLQQQWVGQKVKVIGTTIKNPGHDDVISGWNNLVAGPNGTYTRAEYPNLFTDANERNQLGTVTDVQLEESSNNKLGGTDLFGHPITANNLPNPYVRVTVKMADGSMVATTGYYSTIVGHNMLLNTNGMSRNDEVNAHLEKLIGKTIYKLGSTEILKDNVTQEELADNLKRQIARDIFVKNLTPMKIVEGKVMDDGETIILRVELPDQSNRIVMGTLMTYDSEPANLSFWEKAQLHVVDRMPKLTGREREAVANGEVYVGMREDVLFMTMGYPTTTNDYGNGGEQYIYGKSTYIYTRNGRVTDTQSIGGD